MADDQAAFMAAIRAAPADDLPRLVYADWLEERGDPERAEFIRLQCWLARAADGDPALAAAQRQEGELLAANHDRWWRQLYGALVTPRNLPYERGFAAYLEVNSARDFTELWEPFTDLTPTSRLMTGWTFDEDVGGFARCPGLARITELWTNHNGVGLSPEGLAVLLGSPFAQGLNRLHLGSNQWFGREDCDLLGAMPVLPRLRHLGLTLNYPAGGDRVVALLRSPQRAALRGLEVWYFNDEDVEQLWACPELARMTHLDFGSNSITDRGAAALAWCPHLGAIEHLALGGTSDPLSTAAEVLLRDRFGRQLCLDPEVYSGPPPGDRHRWQRATGLRAGRGLRWPGDSEGSS